MLIIRKDVKAHGTKKPIEGTENVSKGRRVALVEDVITTGGSVIRGIKALQNAGYVVPLVVTLLDRLEGGREAIEAHGVDVRSIFTREDFQ